MPDNCRYVSRKLRIGICDDPDPAKNPAYLAEFDETQWIGIIENPRTKNIGFYAIDHYLRFKKNQRQCDGLLHYENKLIFVELKDRQATGWLGDGCKQLIATIMYFKENSSLKNFNVVTACICNKQRLFFHSNYSASVQEFKDITGVKLQVQQVINIE